MKKSKIGSKLLWALIPQGLLNVILWMIWFALPSTALDPANRNAAVGVLVLLMLLSVIALLGTLVAGVALKFIGRSEINREREEGQHYAQGNNWQRIADSTWKKYIDTVTMVVDQEFKSPLYNLIIEMPGDKVVSTGYGKSVYALSFGTMC